MLTIFALMCALIWLPILYNQFSRRGLLILILWLFIAPIATNIIKQPGSNPFFSSPVIKEATLDHQVADAYLTDQTTIRLNELLEPTRAIFVSFLIVFLGNLFLKKRYFIRLDRTEICMVVFSTILIVNVIWQSERIAFSLRTASDAFIIPFIGYYLTKRHVRTEQQFQNLIRIMGFMGIYLIVVCFVERIAHEALFYRISGPFSTSNTLHSVMAVVFFIVLLDTLYGAGSQERSQALPQSIRWFVLCLAPVIILLTLSRGNWAGLLLGLWVFLFLGRRLVSFSRKVGAVGFALILASLLMIGLPLLIPGELMERRIGNLPNIYGRFATWSTVIQEGIKDPIFGIGLNNLRNVLAESTSQFGGERTYTTVHNSFLSMFSELGAIGTIAYLTITISIIRTGMNLYRTGLHPRDRWRGVALIAIMAAYLSPALFANTLYTLTPLHHLYTYVFAGAVAGLDVWRGSAASLRVPLGQPMLVNPKARVTA